MFNLIKMDFYRLVNAKSFKVLFIVLAAIFLIESYVYYSEVEEVAMKATQAQDTQTPEDAFLEYLESGEVGADEDSATDFFNGMQDAFENEEEAESHIFKIKVETGESDSNSLQIKEGKTNLFSIIIETLAGATNLLFIAIFITLFVCAEYKHGFEKNIAGHYPNRIKPIISKFIVVTTYCIFIVATQILFTISIPLIMSDNLYVADFDKYAPFIGTYLLMSIAFAWLICFLCIASRSTAFSMTLGILLSSGFTLLVYQGIDTIIDKIIGENNFTIADETLEVAYLNLGNVSTKLSEAIPTKMIIIPLAYMVFSTVVSIIIMRRRDVR